MSLKVSHKALMVKMAERGFTNSKLARQMVPPVSRQAVNDMIKRIKNGQGMIPRTVHKLVMALRCKVTDLLDEKWVRDGWDKGEKKRNKKKK